MSKPIPIEIMGTFSSIIAAAVASTTPDPGHAVTAAIENVRRESSRLSRPLPPMFGGVSLEAKLRGQRAATVLRDYANRAQKFYFEIEDTVRRLRDTTKPYYAEEAQTDTTPHEDHT